jgi:hypothetical protein
VKEREVVREEISNVWSLHLDHDRPTVAQFRGVHLSETRRANRLGSNEANSLLIRACSSASMISSMRRQGFGRRRPEAFPIPRCMTAAEGPAEWKGLGRA